MVGNPTDDLERPRCEHNYREYIYVCHSSSCSSFFIERTIRQESIFEVCGAIVSDNRKVDQKSGGDRMIVHDWLGSACVERIIFAVW